MVDDAARERVRQAIRTLEQEYGKQVSSDLPLLRALLLDTLPTERATIEEATSGYGTPPPLPDPVTEPDTEPTDYGTEPSTEGGGRSDDVGPTHTTVPDPPAGRPVWAIVAVAATLVVAVLAATIGILNILTTDTSPDPDGSAVRTPGADPDATSTPEGLETPTPVESPTMLAPPLKVPKATPAERLHRVFPATRMARWKCEKETASGAGALYAEHCVWRKNPAIYAFFHVHRSVAASAETRTFLLAEGRRSGFRVDQTTWRLGRPPQPGGPLLQFTNFRRGALRNLGDYTYRGFYAKEPYSWTLMGPNADAVNQMFVDGGRFPLLSASQVATMKRQAPDW